MTHKLMFTLSRGIAVLVATSLPVGTAAAQRPVVGVGAYLETYSFADDAAAGYKSVSLITVPFGAEARPLSWAHLGVSGAFASGRATTSDGTKLSISGLTDTDIHLTIPVSQDRFTLAAAVSLPTGKSKYTADEAQVAGLVAADLLPFRLSNWGSGGSLDVSGQVAGSRGGLHLGARVGVQMAQAFDLAEDGTFSYRPGNQTYVRLAADGDVGVSRVAAEVTVHTFANDQVNSQNLYKSGNRIQAMVSSTMAAGRTGRMQLYGGALLRQHGTFVDGSQEDSPSSTMLFFGAGLRQSVASVTVVPTAEIRLLSTSDGVGQGYVGGGGLTLEMPRGNKTYLPTLRARLGQLKVASGVQSGITGFDAGLGIRF